MNRPDLRLVVDGKGTLALEDGKLALAGSINIDEGRVEYEPSRVGTLSDDVVIVGQPRKAPRLGASRDLPLVLDLEVALGRDFRFTGEGLDTRLAGRVQRHDDARAARSTRKGTIRAVAGPTSCSASASTSTAASCIFDGPVDNPALDVVALRKNLAVEAGVELTGTVKRAARAARVESAGAGRREAVVARSRVRGSTARARDDLAALRRRVGVAARPGQEADHDADRQLGRSRRHLGARAPAASVGRPARRARSSRSASASPTACRSSTSRG